jgi:hypothetical protein
MRLPLYTTPIFQRPYRKEKQTASKTTNSPTIEKPTTVIVSIVFQAINTTSATQNPKPDATSRKYP